jgi:hypothetical protein
MLSPKEFQELYISMYEARDDDAREMRRLAAAERRAGNSDRMDSKVAAKYASSEARSAERADKKSKGKHIHGTVDEAVYGGEPKKQEEPKDTRMTVTAADKKANTKAWQNYQSGHKGYKAAPHLGEAKVDKALPEHERSAARLKRYANPSGALALGGGQQRARRAEHEERRGVKKEELEMQLRAHLRERALDAAEKREKESVFKAIKPSKLAKTYPEKSPEELKSLRYAISTSQAKKNMDTSRSDKRYGVER